MPEGLAHRIELFSARGKVAREDGHLFSDPSWIAVMLGQGVTPQQWDPLADTLPIAYLQKKAAEMRDGLHRAIARMPTHAQFIENNCKAPSPV
jgi:tryptophan halogenase